MKVDDVEKSISWIAGKIKELQSQGLSFQEAKEILEMSFGIRIENDMIIKEVESEHGKNSNII